MTPVASVVLIDGKSPLTQGGGFQTYTANLAEILKTLGFTVHIFCFGDRTQVIKSKKVIIHTVKSWVYNLPILRTVELSALPFLVPLLARAIIRDLAPDGPTILWGIGPWSLAGALTKIFWGNKRSVLIAYYPVTFKHEFTATNAAINIRDYGLLGKIKVISVLRLLIPLYSMLEQFALDHCNYIVNHYKSAEAILLDQFGLDRRRFVRFPYSLRLVPRETTTSNVALISSKKPLVLLISRHDGRKGINYLLKAFALLNQKQITYQGIIIGAGKLLNAHRQLASRLHLGNVLLPGFIADPTEYLRSASVYVLSSVEEGSSSISLLEAMQFGLPIVATSVDGIPEDVTDRKSALLVPPYDSYALAQAIELLLKNRRLAARLGREAKRRFLSGHSVSYMRKSLEEFLHKVEKKLIV